MNGILIVDKPAGCTSFGVVAKVRGMAKTKKVGHAGTLDPEATGVLPVFLGGATRFIDLMPNHDKRYTATFILGKTTDTQDTSGAVLQTRPVTAGQKEVAEALARFQGKTLQIPPMYSAVKQDGKRLYELARQGIEVERKPREIEIKRIALLWCDEAAGRYTIDVACSKGTYIRTLCHDLGELLGCGAAIQDLRRTQACGFSLQEARTLEELQSLADSGNFAHALLPVESAFAGLPRLDLDARASHLFKNGVRLSLDIFPGLSAQKAQRLTVFGSDGKFLGLAASNGSFLRHVRVMPS